MEKIINNMVEEIKSRIIRDLKCYSNSSIGRNALQMVLDAYNSYQEEEREGVDYLFNINNKEDLITCIKGGMTSNEIAWLYTQSKVVNTTPLFYFGVNYETPKPVANWESLIKNLIGWLDDILTNVIAYPYALDSYRKLYTHYVTDYMIEEELVP